MQSSKLEEAFSLHRQDKLAEADRIYLEILEKNPDDAAALHFHGVVEMHNGDYEGGFRDLGKSLQLRPDLAHFHHNYAGVCARMGEQEKAVHHFQEAIRLKPDYAEAYQGLTECRSFKGDDELLRKIEAQLDSGALTDQQSSYLCFAAAKICADSEQYDRAFEYYHKGNTLKGAQFRAKQYQQEIDRQIQVFTPAFVSLRSEWGLYDHTPIFVLGMPRSGTTLVEQILASHSGVFGAGELNDIQAISTTIEANIGKNNPYPLCLERLSHINLLELALEYISRLKSLSRGADRVVNKTPINFRHVGLIMLMFPNAKIIHTVRDPIDTCLSCYFQNFSKGQEYSFALEDLAEVYLGYKRIMQHWKKTFPGRIHDIHYEDLVSDQEKSSKALLAFCGLPWEEGCLDFHKTRRGVVTASKFQVRKPIYNTSVKRWKRYEKQLQPLIERLGI